MVAKLCTILLVEDGGSRSAGLLRIEVANAERAFVRTDPPIPRTEWCLVLEAVSARWPGGMLSKARFKLRRMLSPDVVGKAHYAVSLGIFRLLDQFWEVVLD